MLQRLFSGQGRLDRLGYLMVVLLAALLFVLPPAFLVLWSASGVLDGFAMALGGVLWTIAAWIYVCASVRRLHDADLTGWLVLLALAPVVGFAALTLALLLRPGSSGPNRFGARWL